MLCSNKVRLFFAIWSYAVTLICFKISLHLIICGHLMDVQDDVYYENLNKKADRENNNQIQDV